MPFLASLQFLLLEYIRICCFEKERDAPAMDSVMKWKGAYYYLIRSFYETSIMTAHILICPADMTPASTQASTSLVSLPAIPSIQISVLKLIHTKREMKTQNKWENVKLFALRTCICGAVQGASPLWLSGRELGMLVDF